MSEKGMQMGCSGRLAVGTMYYVFVVSEEKSFVLRKVAGIFSYDGTIRGN